MNPTTLTDDQLREAYASECAMSARLYAEGVDTSANEARLDLIEAEMIARNLL